MNTFLKRTWIDPTWINALNNNISLFLVSVPVRGKIYMVLCVNSCFWSFSFSCTVLLNASSLISSCQYISIYYNITGSLDNWQTLFLCIISPSMQDSPPSQLTTLLSYLIIAFNTPLNNRLRGKCFPVRWTWYFGENSLLSCILL